MNPSASAPAALIMDAGGYAGPVLARTLVTSGHSVLLHGAARELVQELTDLGGRVHAVTTDDVPLTGAGSVATALGSARLVDICLSEFGRIDACLVRSAGFAAGSLLDVTEPAFAEVKANLDTTFHMLRALVPAMQRQRNGNIVVITSGHARRPTPQFSVYAAIRAAETALMRSAALTYAADGITINAVGTNYMKFPQFRGGWSDDFEQMRRDTARQELGSMDELSELCALLLGGRARHLVGEFIAMTGGW